jgi:hypothetical protein
MKEFDVYYKSLTGETDGMEAQQRRRGRPRKDEDKEFRYPYLEKADGTPVPWDTIVKIGQKARRVWHALHDIGMAPASWGKASETAYTYFNSELLNVPELDFFRYCEGNWKLLRWASKAYPSWAHNYLKSTDPIDTKAARVNKRKLNLLDDTSLVQFDNDENEGSLVSQSLDYNQNTSASEAAHIPPAPDPVPTQVCSH